MHFFKRMISSFYFAFQGIMLAFRTERNFRIQLSVIPLVAILGIIAGIGSFGWLLILFSVVMVLSSELINTAIEKLCNYACKGEIDPKIKEVKDISAAAVTLAAFASVIVGAVVILPPLLKKLIIWYK